MIPPMASRASGTMFLADTTVRRLARWMRYAGWDVEDGADEPMPRLLHRARREGRCLISRSSRAAFDGFIIRSELLDDQLRAIGNAFSPPEAPLARCGVCNTRLERCDPSAVKDRLPPYVFLHHRRFTRCGSCGRVFWVGTHVRRILARLRRCGIRSGRGPMRSVDRSSGGVA